MKDIEDWICFRCKHYQKRTESQNAKLFFCPFPYPPDREIRPEPEPAVKGIAAVSSDIGLYSLIAVSTDYHKFKIGSKRVLSCHCSSAKTTIRL